MSTKVETVFFILTHWEHGWDIGTMTPNVYKKCTIGERESTRGALDGH